jgi:hypothetical protein
MPHAAEVALRAREQMTRMGQSVWYRIWQKLVNAEEVGQEGERDLSGLMSVAIGA